MIVSDIILQIRSNLGDETTKKWNEIEMLDSINHAYVKLARELRLFMQERVYDVSKDSMIQLLPQNFLDIQKITKGNRNIPIIRAYNDDVPHDYVSIDSNNIVFSSVGRYKMVYYCYYILVSKDDRLLLPLIANTCIVYYAMYLLLQKKPSQTSLQEANMYKQMFEMELMELKRDIYRTHESKFLTTKVIVV